VFKRSVDGGRTWSPLTLLHRGAVGDVVGNAAPIQTQRAGSPVIVIPFCVNNSAVWQTESADDGVTFAAALPVPNATRPEWQWIGLGPPGGMQLASGRLLVCAYHDPNPHWDDGDLSHGHVLLSDDAGATWRVGGTMTGVHFTNECQAVELATPGRVLVNSRGLVGQRLLTESSDGGQSFAPTREAVGLPEPTTGCEGSMVRDPAAGLIYYTGVVGQPLSALRFNLSLFCSADDGRTWHWLQTVDAGPTAYSSLVLMPGGDLGLHYEWAPPPVRPIFLPANTSFALLPSPATACRSAMAARGKQSDAL
jgi:sialidase-1